MSFLGKVTCGHVLEPSLLWRYMFLTPIVIGQKVKKHTRTHPGISEVHQTNCLSQVLTLEVILPLLPLVAPVP